MKKLCNIFVLILTLFGCVLFSACKDKYAELEMAFIGSDGNPLQKVELIIDEINPEHDRSSGSFIVKFLGIKTKDIGEISIYVESDSIVSKISNQKIDGDQCSFNVKATSTGVGKLVVLHKSSGKTSKIDLFVNERATSIELKTQNYMIAVDSENRIDEKDVLTKYVRRGNQLVVGGSDSIYYALATSMPSGVTPIRDEETNLIVGFTASDSVQNGDYVDIYPVARMNGYEPDDEKYEDKIIRVHFVKEFDSLELTSQDALYNLEEIGSKDRPITLIANDTTLTNLESGVHRYNSFSVLINNAGWQNFYSLTTNCDSSSLSVSETNDENSSAVVVAHMYSNVAEEVVFTLTSKYPGNVKEVSKTIYVKGDVKPRGIEVYQQDKLVENVHEINIYNYYQSSSNAMGARFNFVPVDKFSKTDLQSMHLILNPAILNGEYIAQGSVIGVNPIYNELGEKISSQQVGAIGDIPVLTRDNNNVLEFYLNDKEPLKFNLKFIEDGENSRYIVISEDFTAQDTISIKYSEIYAEIEGSKAEKLKATLQTFYSGEEEYLKSIECVSEPLEFIDMYGVKSVEVGAGYISYDQNQIKREPYTDGDISTGVYLNRLNGFDDANSEAYLVYLYSVKGLEDNLGAAKFDVTVSGGGNNPLKLWPMKDLAANLKTDADARQEVLSTASTNITDYNYEDKDTSALVLVFDKNTDVGEYIISINHASNDKTLQTIKCIVYEGANQDDFSVNVETNEYNFYNIDDDGYLFEGYECDYIVAKGDKISLTIELDKVVLNSGLLKNYFLRVVGDIGGESAENFASISIDGNNVEITFNKASYIEGNQYYTIEFGAAFRAYDNIIKENETTPNEVSNTFLVFVYEKVTDENLQINNANVEIYFDNIGGETEGVIGWYNQQETKANLSLSFKENNNEIWNYVQTQDKTTEKVKWYTKDVDVNNKIQKLISNNTLGLHFKQSEIMPGTFIVYAEISQFGIKYEKYCLVTVKQAILTNRLVLNSPVEIDYNGNKYIDLEVGEPFTIDATNYSSSNGEVSHPGVVLAVMDANNQIDTNTVFVRDNVIQVFSNVSAVSGLKLYILSKDLLKNEITDTTTINNSVLELYIKGEDNESFKNAYVVIDLHITDGVNVPYEINSAEDFWQIGEEHKKDKIFKVMCDIDLSNATSTQIKTISEFEGRIITDNDQTFNITGLKLDVNMKNFIEKFSGSMENLNFKVEYAYNYTADAESGLGLIGVNNGTLTNVGIEVLGEVKLVNVNRTSIYFGALVAENNGEILYTNVKSGIKGELTINGNSQVKFGAIAGKNTGSIIGAFTGNMSSEGEQKVMFLGDKQIDGAIVNLKLTSNLTNDNIALGLVCGVNTSVKILDSYVYGKISNAYVIGVINHKGYGNLGGVIGENVIETSNLAQFSITNDSIESISYNDASLVWNLNTIKSAVQIKTSDTPKQTNYVGGVVGLDKNGTYNDCQYQILANTQGISGGQYIGGVAGYTQDGWFRYCSVMSYNWDYSQLSYITGNADLKGVNVGGVIGKAYSTLNGKDNGYNVGEDNIPTTMIHLSSVNAYLKADNRAAGIISEANNSLIFNAYIMGKIESAENKVFNWAENDTTNQSFLSKFYNVYRKTAGVDLPIAIGSADFTTNANGNPDYTGNGITGWGYNENLNGGYVYITKDNNYPIYEVAPTKLTAQVKPSVSETSSTSSHTKPDGTTAVVHLNYYNFILNTQSSTYAETYNALNERFNTYTLEELFKFEYLPDFLRNVQVKVVVEEGKENIISIAQGNKLLVKSTGQCTLTFCSAINPNVKCEILVNVSLPLGDRFVISEDGENALANINEVNIPKGKAKILYLISTGSKTFNGTVYQYKTNQNVQATFEIDEDITNYLSISATKNADGTYTLNANEPFYISAEGSGESFEFNITPYIAVNYGENKTYVIDADEFNFTIHTLEGATGISLNHTSAIVYPNDKTTILAYVKTDCEISDIVELRGLINEVKLNNNVEYNIDDYINYIGYKYINNADKDKIVQIVEFELNLSSFANDNQISEMEIKFKAIQSAKANFTIIPQRINKIDITNYIIESKTATSTNIEQVDVLKQGKNGLIIIDMAPNNGYFDYLEIKDITGGERITFMQVTDENGNRVGMDENTEDGLGIKLNKLDGHFDVENNKSSIYVYTMIDKNAESSTHTIQVSAFLNDGRKLIDNTLEIDVQMLPEVEVDYLTPDRDVVKTITKENVVNVDSKTTAYYVPRNTITEFRVREINATEKVKVKSVIVDSTARSLDIFKDADNNGIFELDTKGLNSGSIIKIELLAKATYANGTSEETILKLEFKVVEFVIYSITASPTTSTKLNEIYGNYGVNIPIIFSFETGDVGYAGDIDQNNDIKTIIEEINKNENQQYFDIGKVSGGQFTAFESNKRENISLTNNVLKVVSGNENTKLGLTYNLKLTDYKWELSSSESTIENIQNVYDLRMVNRTDKLNMEVIKNEEDFLKMSGPNTNYILGADLVLGEKTPYTPMDVDIKLFDGNGRTITIVNFANSTEQNVQMGLFKQIRSGMSVINLNVVYKDFGTISTTKSATDIKVDNYYDLAPANTDVEYTSVVFGGIAAVNNGVISNCTVSGDLALEATKIEQLGTDSSFNIPFNVGGLVGTNSGYITHSQVSARIIAQANIGGVVHTNKGKIASTYFNAKTSKGLIYSYKPAVATSAVIKVAGFVVENSGNISMSYVAVETTTLKFGSVNGNTIGNMSTKNPAAGFVYSNLGEISNSYVHMLKFGLNQNAFSGFVLENSGKISSCYTNINGGSSTNNSFMFAKSTLTGIENCIEINNGAKEKPIGVETLLAEDMYNIEKYKGNGFIFGDNTGEAVWVMGLNQFPMIVSTLDTVEYTESKDAETIELEDSEGNAVKTTTYFGLRNYEVVARNVLNAQTGLYEWVETKRTLELNHGSKENPYVIYSMEAYNLYFDSTQENYSTEYYYRLATDLKFEQVYTEISTSVQDFNGNLQGNNMTISGIRLFSSTSLDSLGMFKGLIGTQNRTVVNSVRNLNLTATQINATKTKAVGALAGVVENFNLYNITFDSEGLVVLGGNTVGGIAGIVRGSFDIDGLSSNVSATSTREVTGRTYSIYNSVANGKEKSENLSSVYYAGSVIGVVDGYKSSRLISASREITTRSYSVIKNIKATGDISLVGDTIGVAFGLVSEYTHVQNVIVSTSGSLYGEQYVGGVAGENRGVIENAIFATENETVFSRTSSIMGGIVGLNLGGLVTNVQTEATIISTGSSSVVGGIVGRNIHGVVSNVSFNGNANGRFVGGILGSDYTGNLLTKKSSGISSLNEPCKIAVPAQEISYKLNGSNVSNLSNVEVGTTAINYWIANLNSFYNHELNESEIKVSANSKVLGLLVGLTDNKSKYNAENIQHLINTNNNQIIEYGKVQIPYTDGDTAKTCTVNDVYKFTYEQQAILYIVGSEVYAVDSWAQSDYCANYMLILLPVQES